MEKSQLVQSVRKIRKMTPFIGPETQERINKKKFHARVGANENPFGPSPDAVEVIEKNAGEVWKYGDPEVYILRKAISRFHEIDFRNILVGEGIDGLISNIARLLINVGDKVVSSLGGYPTFDYHIFSAGGDVISVPYANDLENLNGLIEAAQIHRPRLLYIVNPDNPMGTWWTGKKIEELIENIPSETLVILDEAYFEFAPDEAIAAINPENPKVIRFRTFSKAYGLAGLRVGYAIGNAALINEFEKVRNHFGVNVLAQTAAVASLKDQKHLNYVKSKINQGKKRLYEIAYKNNLHYIDSATNFVTIDCGQDGIYAKRVLDEFINKGIFVRMPMVPPLNRCIRISIGTDEEIDLIKKYFPEVLRLASN